MTVSIEDLKGEILSDIIISKEDDRITFKTESGNEYEMLHYQDCCENVFIEDINGDVSKLIGKEILIAEERVSHDTALAKDENWLDESNTWTFYRIATFDETVIIRWWGSSNGYYSESVDFCKVN